MAGVVETAGPGHLTFAVIVLGALVITDVALGIARHVFDRPPPPRRWDDSPHTAGRMEASLDRTLAGRRVRLIRCDDPYTALRPGALGTVTFRDDVGTLHIRWDEGSNLGLAEDAGDRWEFVDD